MTDRLPVAVIGAGAAGLVSAIFAARAGARVILLERTHDGGRKILISGGGRCNILPSVDAPERFVTDSSRNSLRNILRSWPLAEQHTFFERELGMPLVLEPETGKLFPRSDRARDVRDALVARAREAGVDIQFNVRVRDLERKETAESLWHVVTDKGPLSCSSVVLATGGLSVPKTGSDGVGLDVANRFGHTMHPTYPALTPLLADPPPHAHLAGISVGVTLRSPSIRAQFTGGFLFTHRGYSGPAVLDASHLVSRASLNRTIAPPIAVQWSAQDTDGWDRTLREGRKSVGAVVTQTLPARLADQLLDEAGVDRRTILSQLSRVERRAVTQVLCEYELPVTGDEGYKKAEVTGGGVALSEIHPRTMESRRVPGLFLCGEMLDAFGPIGGYNFQWAWATGRAAGIGVAAER